MVRLCSIMKWPGLVIKVRTARAQICVHVVNCSEISIICILDKLTSTKNIPGLNPPCKTGIFGKLFLKPDYSILSPCHYSQLGNHCVHAVI